MKEREIRKKAIKILEDQEWVCWFPSRIKWKKETDIFGVFDLICWQKRTANIKFVQLTTLPNLSTRKKKIKDFLKKNKLSAQVSVEIVVWGWDQKKREFKKEEINIKIKKKYSRKLKKK